MNENMSAEGGSASGGKIIIWIIVIVVAVAIIGIGIYFLTKPIPKTVTADCIQSISNATVTYTKDQTFIPACVVIRSGTKINWVNQSNEVLKIGADPHPIHSGNKEVSGGKFTLDIAPGQSAQVTMTKTGTFGYHNHAHSSSTGTIQVK